jgi:hypothetical protein
MNFNFYKDFSEFINESMGAESHVTKAEELIADENYERAGRHVKRAIKDISSLIRKSDKDSVKPMWDKVNAVKTKLKEAAKGTNKESKVADLTENDVKKELRIITNVFPAEKKEVAQEETQPEETQPQEQQPKEVISASSSNSALKDLQREDKERVLVLALSITSAGTNADDTQQENVQKLVNELLVSDKPLNPDGVIGKMSRAAIGKLKDALAKIPELNEYVVKDVNPETKERDGYMREGTLQAIVKYLGGDITKIKKGTPLAAKKDAPKGGSGNGGGSGSGTGNGGKTPATTPAPIKPNEKSKVDALAVVKKMYPNGVDEKGSWMPKEGKHKGWTFFPRGKNGVFRFAYKTTDGKLHKGSYSSDGKILFTAKDNGVKRIVGKNVNQDLINYFTHDYKNALSRGDSVGDIVEHMYEYAKSNAGNFLYAIAQTNKMTSDKKIKGEVIGELFNQSFKDDLYYIPNLIKNKVSVTNEYIYACAIWGAIDGAFTHNDALSNIMKAMNSDRATWDNTKKIYDLIFGGDLVSEIFSEADIDLSNDVTGQPAWYKILKQMEGDDKSLWG